MGAAIALSIVPSMATVTLYHWMHGPEKKHYCEVVWTHSLTLCTIHYHEEGIYIGYIPCLNSHVHGLKA